MAFFLIGNPGAASAQEAPPSDPSSDEATVGEPLYVERPAPRPDPANELGSAEASADSPAAPAPRPAPTAPAPRSSATAASTPAPAPAAARKAAAPAPASSAASTPARATEVQGLQIVRPALPADGTEVAALAFTGTDREVGLTVLAGVLLALGAALIRLSRSRHLA